MPSRLLHCVARRLPAPLVLLRVPLALLRERLGLLLLLLPLLPGLGVVALLTRGGGGA